MYSRRDRGRRPASYCASSSRRPPTTKRSLIGQRWKLSHQLAKCSLERLFKRGRAGRGECGINGSFRQRAMIAQILKRGEQVVAKSVIRRNGGRAIDVWNRQLRQPILQLEDDSLRSLAADTRNARQTCDVRPLHGCDQLPRFDTRQHGDRQLWSDAADSDEPFEQLLFERGEKTVQLKSILTHVCMDAQSDLSAGIADVVVRRQWNVDLVSHAMNVDDDQVRLLVEDGSAEKRNHPAVRGRYWRQLRGFAEPVSGPT